MKKQIAIALALLVSSFSFAQKDELKAAEKAIKSGNYADAKAAINSAESLIASADDKTKAQFYFLKGKSFYANGLGSSVDLDTAIESFNKVEEIEGGKGKFSPEVLVIKQDMLNSTLTKANDALQSKKYAVSSSGFEKAYRMSTKDTIYLYYAAATAINAEDYDNALKFYEELKSMNYDGVEVNYLAINKDTGEEENFPTLSLRDIAVKSNSHMSPRVEKTPSKKAEIVKNIALIYMSKGETEKAIEYMTAARKVNPDDSALILAEANLQLKMGNKDEFKSLIEQVLSKDPNNVELLFNLGIIAAEGGETDKAKQYYEKALSLDPNNPDVNTNMAVLILDGEKAIIDEMNSLGSSAADNKKYDQLRLKREGIYKQAVPFLESTIRSKPNDIQAAKTLLNIYSVLDDTEKYKALKVKVEALESGN